MPDVIIAEHKWVGAAYVTLDPKQAKYAARRGSFRVAEKDRIEVLEVYCATCKRPFDDLADETDCVITHHLRGGPIGERKKRLGPDGQPLARDASLADL